MDKKICGKCKIEKSINEFSFKNKRKNIRHNACKDCWKEIRKISYEKDKSVTRKRNRRNKNKNQKWYNEYKSNLRCNRCPETHISCLEFHHNDPTEKEFNVSTLIGTYSIEKIREEIEKCEVLCANCHRKHHYELNQIHNSCRGHKN